MTIDPAMPGPYMLLAGLTAYTRNNFADAVALAERAKELGSGDPAHFFNLASLYIDLGDHVHVSRLLDAARQRWPDDAPVVSWMSAYRGLLRADETATSQSAQTLLDIEPRNPAGLIFLADSVLRLRPAAPGRQGPHRRTAAEAQSAARASP